METALLPEERSDVVSAKLADQLQDSARQKPILTINFLTVLKDNGLPWQSNYCPLSAIRSAEQAEQLSSEQLPAYL